MFIVTTNNHFHKKSSLISNTAEIQSFLTDSPAIGAPIDAHSPGNIEGNHPDEERLPRIHISSPSRRRAFYSSSKLAPFYRNCWIRDPVSSFTCIGSYLHQEGPCLVQNSEYQGLTV